MIRHFTSTGTRPNLALAPLLGAFALGSAGIAGPCQRRAAADSDVDRLLWQPAGDRPIPPANIS